MPEVNYITHLNNFFLKLSKDTRLNTTHVSMYMALFNFWNQARFSSEFFINRNEVMTLSRIGSKGTYHKCIKDLSDWKYIIYMPSKNPNIGSKIKMYNFSTSSEQATNQQRTEIGTSCEQVSGPYINNTKQKKHLNVFKPQNKNEVIIFFEENKWPTTQAEKFFSHYESVGWKKGKSKIENWQAAAEGWMIHFRENEENNVSAQVQNKDNHRSREGGNLHTNKNKNYNQPL
uniref:hypothetical protein n=2 Tax=Gelidibacter sp. TaxID=2018083 RepID=UPI00404B52FA